MTKIIYVICSYVIIGVLGFIGLRHIDSLNDKIISLEMQLESEKESMSMLIDAYNQEIEDLKETAKERKVVIKEVVKLVKGTKDEECLNRTIPDVVLEQLRKQSGGKR